MTIPKMETLNTLYLGTLDPSGGSTKKRLLPTFLAVAHELPELHLTASSQGLPANGGGLRAPFKGAIGI